MSCRHLPGQGRARRPSGGVRAGLHPPSRRRRPAPPSDHHVRPLVRPSACLRRADRLVSWGRRSTLVEREDAEDGRGGDSQQQFAAFGLGARARQQRMQPDESQNRVRVMSTTQGPVPCAAASTGPIAAFPGVGDVDLLRCRHDRHAVDHLKGAPAGYAPASPPAATRTAALNAAAAGPPPRLGRRAARVRRWTRPGALPGSAASQTPVNRNTEKPRVFSLASYMI